jgi:hypothetical protein
MIIVPHLNFVITSLEPGLQCLDQSGIRVFDHSGKLIDIDPSFDPT